MRWLKFCDTLNEVLFYKSLRFLTLTWLVINNKTLHLGEYQTFTSMQCKENGFFVLLRTREMNVKKVTAITDCNSLKMFKRKLKDYLFQLYFSNS